LDKDLEHYLAGAATDAKRRQALIDDWQAFPNELLAASTDYHPETLTNWDDEIEKRPFTGIGVSAVGEKALVEGEKFDLLEPGLSNLVTHILAQELTEAQIYEALTNGHAYVAHDWLGDPTGFSFGAVNNLGVFSMGDSAPIQGNTRVVGATPVPARLRLIHKGEVVEETTGTNLTFQAKQPGPYRLEAWLTVDGEDRPWIYSNPVYLRNPGPGDLRPPPAADWDKVDARKNISYREGPEEDSAKHKLDVYSPSGKSNSPVLFFIHGGAWKSGDRGLYPMLGNRFARAGFVTVVPSYRLAPKNPHPAQIEDVAAAFAWTVRHVGEFNGDTNRIYVAGHSAGGHLAALLSLDDRQLAPYHLSPKIIRGVLALSGVYNLTNGESLESVFGKDAQRRREASPLFQIKAGAPPFLVAYCQWDYLTLPAQARQFNRALRQAGVASELIFIPRENHISEMVNISQADAPLAAAMLKFMNH